MSKPDIVPDFTALSQPQVASINDGYLRSQVVTDEAILRLAGEITHKNTDTPVSLPLFFEYLREGRSKQQVLEVLLQYYCTHVTQEVNASSIYRHFRAPKRPMSEGPKSKSKQRKKR